MNTQTQAVEATLGKLESLERNGNLAAGAWIGNIESAREDSMKTALKTWLRGRDRVSTLQATAQDGKIISLWTPGERTVSIRATYADFSGSRRDYAGVTCIYASPHSWVGYDASTSTVLVYN